MSEQNFKKIPAFLLLLVFLGAKSVEYHPLTHSDEGNITCEWCDLALVFHATPFQPATTTAVEFVILSPFEEELQQSYASVFNQLLHQQSLFSRPPPHKPRA